MKVIKVNVKGVVTILRETELEDLQDAVGGYVEAVYLNKTPFVYEGIDYDIMLVNEDGLSLDLEYNNKGTEMYHLNTLPNDNIVVGSVVFTSKEVWN